jgi:membrane fusion protein (multidrug efflux system)
VSMPPIQVPPSHPTPKVTERNGMSLALRSPSKTPMFAIVGIVTTVLVLGAAMMWRAESKTNKVALAGKPKPVTVVKAVDSSFQATRTYVGTLEPWVEAKIGPQIVSAYVDTVLVRPGATVAKGAVLATLDCRNASAQSQAVAMEARALDAKQKAIADEASRLSSLLDGGFVSANTAEQKVAQSASEQANLLAEKAKLLGTSLGVSDCVLRAPFDGDIGSRDADPGAFVHPGDEIVTLVDRSTVRLVAAVPENDFEVVAPGSKAHVRFFANDQQIDAEISRRAPAADPGTRTIHVEIDIPDPNRVVPVYTTGEVTMNVGKPIHATRIPLSAATIRSKKVSVFVVEGNVAHKRRFKYLGESGSYVYLDTSLSPGTLVVSEGRALLANKDRVAPKEAQ